MTPTTIDVVRERLDEAHRQAARHRANRTSQRALVTPRRVRVVLARRLVQTAERLCDCPAASLEPAA